MLAYTVYQNNSTVYTFENTVIIIHGLLGSQSNWYNFSNILQKNDYRVITIDLPNHGNSPSLEPYTYNTIADTVYQTIHALSIKKAHILGHSMGGKVAMKLAQLYPDCVYSLAVLDIAPKIYVYREDSGHMKILTALLQLPLHTVTGRNHANNLLETAIPSYQERIFLLKNLIRLADGSFKWQVNLPILMQYYPQICQWDNQNIVVSIPTLFLRAAHAEYITDRDEFHIKKYFSCSSIVKIDAGHWLHAEKQEECLQAVQLFWDNIDKELV